MKRLKKACAAYLLHAEKNGIRRIYETLPGWMRENFPKLYKVVPEFKQLEKVLGKNDLRYRALNRTQQEKIRKRRVSLWERIAKRVEDRTPCEECGKFKERTWGRRVPVPLSAVLIPRKFCSRQCATSSNIRTEKIRATNLARYGVTCTLNSKEGIRKKKATWRAKWGVENPSQAPDILEKIQKARYGRREIELNGKTFQYQGYEAVVLKRLAPKEDVKSFTSKASDIGLFSYSLGGRSLRYLPDIKATLKSGKVIYIEVKSLATLNSTKAIGRKVKAKARAMWEDHKVPYIVALCSENSVIAKARNYEELRTLMRKHQPW